MLTQEQLEDGVDKDGTIDDPYMGIETYYRPMEVIATTDRGYVRVVADDGMTNIETRIPFESLEAQGWTRPAPVAMAPTSGPCRRCSECAESDHHWMPNGDFGAADDDPDFADGCDHRSPTGNPYICKHCDAVGDDCPRCGGPDICGEDDEERGDSSCIGCGGTGIVVATPKKFSDLDL